MSITFLSNPVTYFIISILSALIIILGGIQAMNNAKKQDEQIDTLQSQLAKSLDISEKIDSNTKDIKDIQEKFSRLLRQESEKADKYKQERLLESKDYFASTFRHINSRITSLVVHSYFRDFQYFDITRNEAKEIFKLFLSLKENIFLTENPNLKDFFRELEASYSSSMATILTYDNIPSDLDKLRDSYNNWCERYNKFFSEFYN